jgi:hypothetical protein
MRNSAISQTTPRKTANVTAKTQRKKGLMPRGTLSVWLRMKTARKPMMPRRKPEPVWRTTSHYQ